MSNPNPSYKIPKGTTPNPNGRPKRDWTWAGLIEESMEEMDETGVPYKKIIARKLRTLARKGDMAAIKEIQNRMDGMPQQKTDLTTKGESLNIPDEQLKRIINPTGKAITDEADRGSKG